MRPTSSIAAVVAALLLAGCSAGPLRSARPTSTPTQAPPASMPGTERFYAQSLAWSDCGGGAECATLEVPMDYDEPGGDTIGIEVLRVRARKDSQWQGSLLVNPGGPGASGMEYAKAADFIVGKGVRDRFDIVGFDPRGVGRSAPIDCVSDSDLDTFLGGDPTPDDAGEQQAFADTSAQFAADCKANAGPLLAHVSTIEAAKDIDILRAALGEQKLTYLGKSYGTYLGAVYADLFPQTVGRFVLDGAIAPDLTAAEINLGQAKGFETATRAWAQYCVDEGNCPLGSSQDDVMQGLRDFLTQVDKTPLTKTGDPSIAEVSEGWASTGVAAAMYDQGSWATLIGALRSAVDDGDASSLLGLANSYADRNPGGGYNGNIMEAISAVNCLDKPGDSSIADTAAAAEKAREVSPTWGPFLMWSSMTCGFWPYDGPLGDSAPTPITAEGAPPIVVVGTTRDPATPYEWSVRLADQLADSRLITYDGDGHTAYTRSNSCVDTPIDAFFIDGTVPTGDLRC